MNLLKNKFIFTFFCILFFVNLIFFNNTFAVSLVDSSKNVYVNFDNISIPDNCYYLIYYTDDIYIMFVFDTYVDFSINSVVSSYAYISDKIDFGYYAQYTLYADGTYKINYAPSSREYYVTFRMNGDKEYLVASNFNIYNKAGDLLFQKPVLTLGGVLELTNPVKTFQIMTHGMITYLIVFLVGLVAFWKGWQFLFKELHKV